MRGAEFYFRRTFWKQDERGCRIASSFDEANLCILEVCHAGGYGWQLAEIAEFEWPKDKYRCEKIERGLRVMYTFGGEDKLREVRSVLGIVDRR